MQKNFSLLRMSWPAVIPTPPLVQWIPGVKRPGCEPDYKLFVVANGIELYLTSNPACHPDLHSDKFTFTVTKNLTLIFLYVHWYKYHWISTVSYSRERDWNVLHEWWVAGHNQRTVGFTQRKLLPRSTVNSILNKLYTYNCMCNV
jgi:hypothetical protein